ncbi:Hypothetical protein POVN_LOCUS243 [uncultured virus]|nr:Hypothetical protein POVN_LOCUS243 [uncultured virus]
MSDVPSEIKSEAVPVVVPAEEAPVKVPVDLDVGKGAPAAPAADAPSETKADVKAPSLPEGAGDSKRTPPKTDHVSCAGDGKRAPPKTDCSHGADIACLLCDAGSDVFRKQMETSCQSALKAVGKWPAEGKAFISLEAKGTQTDGSVRESLRRVAYEVFSPKKSKDRCDKPRPCDDSDNEEERGPQGSRVKPEQHIHVHMSCPHPPSPPVPKYFGSILLAASALVGGFLLGKKWR